MEKEAVREFEGEPRIKMVIEPGARGFYIEMQSQHAMTHEEIVIHLEEWINKNLLCGFKVEHPPQ